jgi:hypothetical protein
LSLAKQPIGLVALVTRKRHNYFFMSVWCFAISNSSKYLL